jgi:hypothetical protein
LPLRRFWAAVLSARGGVLLIGNIKGPARPGRIRCDSEPPTDPAALIGLPSPSQAFCARTLPLAGWRARPMRAGRRQTNIVCIAASSAPGTHPGPLSAHGFSAPFQRRRADEHHRPASTCPLRPKLLAGVAGPSAY